MTLHFRTDKAIKSNYNTFVCLKEYGAALIGELCQESDKKKRKEWKEKLLKDYLRHCIFEYVCEVMSYQEIAKLLDLDEQLVNNILKEMDFINEQLSDGINKVVEKLIELWKK